MVFKDASLANKDIPNVAEAVADNAKAETDNTVTPVDIEDGLTAIKTANPESGSVVNTGNEITYNITVTNTSKEDKKNVMIRDMVPELTEYVSGGTLKTISGKSYVTFLVDTLKAGESKTESFKVKVTGTGLATIKNVAQVKTSDEPDKHWEDDDFVDTNKVIHTIPYIVTEVVPALSIEKSSDKETYSVGDTGHYTVKVSETEKDAAAKDVIIKDAIENNAADILTDTIKITDPDGKDITKEVEIKSTKSGYTIKTGKDLSYGKAFTVTYDVKFTKASVANEKVRNVAKATAENLTTTTTKDVTPGTYKDENGNALFEIVKDSDPANGSTVNVGDDIKYSIKVKNTSEKDISNIHILDAVPTGTTYKDGGDVKDINGVSYVAFTIDTLKAGEEKTVSFTVTVNESADKQVANKALVKVTDKDDDTDLSSYQETNEVTHPLPSWVEDDNEVTVIAPSLTIQKASDKDVYQVGETGHYTVTVGQDTENAVAKNVVIKDALQVKGAEIQTATIKIVDTNGKDITNKVDNITKDTSGYTIETGRNLAFGETFTVTYDVLFKDGSLAGQAVKNIAKAKADNASAKTDNDVTPVTVEDGLTALKSAEPASGTQVKAGDEITYNIEVTNTSNEEKKNVLVLDAVPDKTTYVEGSGGKLVEISGKSYVSFTVPSVAAGASESVSFKVKVADTVTDDDVITNVALVKKADKENPKDPSSWTPDSFVPTNEVKHPTSDWVETEKEVTVDGPEMAIEKTSDKNVYGVGETGHYTVKLSQTKENREEYNNMLLDKMSAGRNNLTTDRILTVSVPAENVKEAIKKFARIDVSVTDEMSRITKTECSVLSAIERLELLNDVYNMDDNTPLYQKRMIDGHMVESFSLKECEAQGRTTQSYIVPGQLSFGQYEKNIGNVIKVGNMLARPYYVSGYPSWLRASTLTDFSTLSGNILISAYFTSESQGGAADMLKRQTRNIRSGIIDRQQKSSTTTDVSIIAPDLSEAKQEADELQESIAQDDNRLFYGNILFVIFAKTAAELKRLEDELYMKGKTNLLTIRPLLNEMEQAFDSALPIGNNYMSYTRLMTTETVASLTPFSVKEIYQKSGLYYGLNASNKTMTFYDRSQDTNPCGVILGMPGAGKSFSAKREMESIWLGTQDDIYVLDPEREYAPMAKAFGGTIIRISNGSKAHINPFDINLQNAGEDGDPIKVKSDFIQSLCETAIGGRFGLSQIEKSLIGRCATRLYTDHVRELQATGKDMNPKTAPTMVDFYNLLMTQPEPEAANIALALERFVSGSDDLFSHHSNIDVKNRFVVYDIKDIGSGLKELGLQIAFDAIWNKMIENRAKGKRTWIYIDEFYLLMSKETSAEYISTIWKRARKWNGVPTAITQNVEDMLKSEQARTVINNSQFVTLLQQSPVNKKQLSNLLGLTIEEQKYISTSKPGMGLLKIGEDVIPINDDFPKDTHLYKIMTTKPDELIEA